MNGCKLKTFREQQFRKSEFSAFACKSDVVETFCLLSDFLIWQVKSVRIRTMALPTEIL